jgi:hypothetical protein
MRILRQQANAGHDHPGSAVSALQCVGFDERFLERVKLSVLFKTFDRDNLFTGHLTDLRDTGTCWFTIDQYSASAALRFSTAVLRASQIQIVPQRD